MFAAALLLLILSVLLFILGVFGGGKVPLHLGPVDLGTSVAVIFVMGMVTLLLFMVSISLFRSGARRAVGRRRERKQYNKLSRKLDRYQQDETDTDTSAGTGTGTSPSAGDTTTDGPRD